MKQLLIMGIACIFVVLLISCSEQSKSFEYDMESVLEIALYPGGSTDDVYQFVLTEDKELIARKGSKEFSVSDDGQIYINKLSDTVFLREIEYCEKTNLSKEVFDEIFGLTDKIYQKYYGEDFAPYMVDGIDIQILYQGKLIERHCDIIRDSLITELVDKIKLLSPVELIF